MSNPSPTTLPWPFKLVLLDAELGRKPTDSRFGVRTYRELYEIGKDHRGSKCLVRRRCDVVDGSRSSSGGVNEGSGKAGGGGGGGGKKGEGGERKKGDVEKKEQKTDQKSAPAVVGGGNAQEKTEAFTPEEDAKLKQMKLDNKTWREIAAEMSRPQSHLKARFKEINKDSGATAGDQSAKAKLSENQAGSKGKPASDQKSKKDESTSKAADKAPRNKEKKKTHPSTNNPADPRNTSPTKSSSNSQHRHAEMEEPRFTKDEWITLTEDDLFDLGELQCLSELLMRDERRKWVRLAADFFDTTGRRVHADDLREKFEELAEMAV